MSRFMVAKDPAKAISVIHHEQETYKPDGKGRFEVQDGHVDPLRAHGLQLEEEAAATAAPGKGKKGPDQSAELAAANARIAELEAALAAARKK